MKKIKNKGFTLIELLVVVAIIGILAAVGTVAYTGYTANAKKAAAKSNHASVVKYIAAELQRCNMDETTSMDSKLVCNDRTTKTTVQTAAALALADFKNPFDTANLAVSTAATAVGFVNVTDDGSDVTVTTCFAEIGKTDDKDAACVAADSTSTLSNTILIE